MDPAFAKEFKDGMVWIIREALTPLNARLTALETYNAALDRRIAELEGREQTTTKTALRVVNDVG